MTTSVILPLLVQRDPQLVHPSLVALLGSAEGASGRTPLGLLLTPQHGCIDVAPSYRRRKVGHLGASRLLAISSWRPYTFTWLFIMAFVARPCSESLRPLLQGSRNWPVMPCTLLFAVQRRDASAGGASG